MDTFTIIGLLAAFCTTISFFPQVIKTIKTKQTKDLSRGMYSLLTGGILLWLIYGILIENLPLIVANLITLIFSSIILLSKIRYG
jgi:MtN3 and saliva related transmembrane protein